MTPHGMRHEKTPLKRAIDAQIRHFGQNLRG